MFYHSNLKFSAISKERRRTASPSSSSPSRGLPSFRFSAADEELTEIIDELADGETEIENKLRIELKGIFQLAPISPATAVAIDLLFLESETKKNLQNNRKQNFVFFPLEDPLIVLCPLKFKFYRFWYFRPNRLNLRPTTE